MWLILSIFSLLVFQSRGKFWRRVGGSVLFQSILSSPNNGLKLPFETDSAISSGYKNDSISANTCALSYNSVDDKKSDVSDPLATSTNSDHLDEQNTNNSEPRHCRLGLKNLRNTCYFNSVIQALFSCDPFCKKVVDSSFIEKSIGSELQSLFRSLQISEISSDYQKSYVDPSSLVKALNIDIRLQEDAHELLLKLLNGVETSLVSSESFQSNQDEREHKKESIIDLFKGKFIQTISCLDVDFTKQKDQKSYDLSISVENSDNIMDGIYELLEPDFLTGDNKFKAGSFGYQDAVKQLHIASLPSILIVHLKRFSYDIDSGRMRKLSNQISYPFNLDLTSIIGNSVPSQGKDKESTESFVYDLVSTLVHEGSVDYGHYTAFAKSGIKNLSWYEFNDEIVRLVDEESVTRAGFGGKGGKFSKNSYLLFYVKK